MQSPFIKWSLVAAVFCILLKLSIYVINPAMVDGPVIALFTFGVFIFAMAKLALEHRALNGGFISFGEAFKYVFFGVSIYYFLSVGFDFIFKSMIAPDLIEKNIEQAVAMVEKVKDMMGENLTDEEYDAIVQKSQPSFSNFIQAFIAAVLCGGLIISLIIALIVKRENRNQELL